jgi:hypothetical protein
MTKLVTLSLIAGLLVPGTGWLLFTWADPSFANGLVIISACSGIGLGGHFLWQYYRKHKHSGIPEEDEWRTIEKVRYLLAKEALLERAKQRSAVRRQGVVQ